MSRSTSKHTTATTFAIWMFVFAMFLLGWAIAIAVAVDLYATFEQVRDLLKTR